MLPKHRIVLVGRKRISHFNNPIQNRSCFSQAGIVLETVFYIEWVY